MIGLNQPKIGNKIPANPSNVVNKGKEEILADIPNSGTLI